MSLPVSYTKTTQIRRNPNYSETLFLESIYDEIIKHEGIKKCEKTDEKIEFVYKSLFNIEYTIEISIKKNHPNSIEIDIKLNRLIQICIVLVLCIAFFSSLGFSGFLWFSAVFTLIFYILNIFVIDKSVQTLISQDQNTSDSENTNAEKISKEQQNWINDKTKCPACGETITEFDTNCPECGLKLKDKEPNFPFNVSKYRSKRIIYFFKKKK